MKTLFSLIISAALVASGYSQTRNVLVGTNNAVVQPTNFWSANATNARSGLGLGSAATNAASAFQPSSAVLTNLASSNAVNLTNIRVTNIVGWSAITNTNSSTSLLGYTTNGTVVANTGANALAFTNAIRVGDVIISTDSTISVGQSIVDLAEGSLNYDGTTGLLWSGNTVSFYRPIAFNNTSNAATTRTNLLLGATWLTNTNVTNFRTAINLGWSALTNTNAATSLLGFTTNGQVVANTGTNTLRFENDVSFLGGPIVNGSGIFYVTPTNGGLNLEEQLLIDDSNNTVLNWGNSTILSVGRPLGFTTNNAATTRTNLGLGWSALTNTNASNFCTAINLGWSALTNTNAATSLLGFTTNGRIVAATNVVWTNAFNFSTNTVAAQVRTNLGLGWSALTNTNFGTATNTFCQGNDARIANIKAGSISNQDGIVESGADTNRSGGGGGTISMVGGNAYSGDGGNAGSISLNGGYNEGQGGSLISSGSDFTSGGTLNMSGGGDDDGGSISTYDGGGSINTRGTGTLELGVSGTRTTFVGAATSNITVSLPQSSVTLVGYSTNGTVTAQSRTNIGLGATWLTNTNVTNFRTAIGLGATWLTNTNTAGFNTSLYGSGTNPVLYNTNGEVVSPTNFWQVAPIQTLVQDLTVIVTSQTNNATNARNLYVYSLATNVAGISNTIILPTNAATFAGDEATVIHRGNTNTTTVIRQAGSTNNLITLSRFDEAVKFIRESGQWNFYHNISYVEAIQFSGTNTSNNIAVTRTNLGLPLPALTNSNTTNFQAAVFQTNTTPAGAAFNTIVAWMEVNVFTNGSNTSFRIPLFK
jgi:hypothetical protein